MSSSLHIEFQELYWSTFIVVSLITTNPYFNVISGGRGQLYIEPWWWAEGTTGASRTTPLSIPEGVTIWVENSISTTSRPVSLNYACLAEVVLARKWGNSGSIGTSADTGACCLYIGILFTNTTSKGPDVLTGGAMRYAYSMHRHRHCWLTDQNQGRPLHGIQSGSQ